MFPFFDDYFNTMACYARLARLPVGHGSDLNQPTKRDWQTKNRKCKPKKGNDKIKAKRRQRVVLGRHLIGLQETMYKLTDKLVIFQSQYQEKN